MLTFHGVRGSTPCDGHQYSRYGGSTSSVALECPGHAPVIFDLGTGVRAYGDEVTAKLVADLTANRASSPYTANVLLTHLHWDHIIGLPFFTPAFRPDARIDVYGPRQLEGTLREVFTGVMRPPYFPITPDQLGADVQFQEVGDDAYGVNGAKVTSRTHQASASLRLRATPASISVSRTRRSLIRSRVIPGTARLVKR